MKTYEFKGYTSQGNAFQTKIDAMNVNEALEKLYCYVGTIYTEVLVRIV